MKIWMWLVYYIQGSTELCIAQNSGRFDILFFAFSIFWDSLLKYCKMISSTKNRLSMRIFSFVKKFLLALKWDNWEAMQIFAKTTNFLSEVLLQVRIEVQKRLHVSLPLLFSIFYSSLSFKRLVTQNSGEQRYFNNIAQWKNSKILMKLLIHS